MNPHRLRLVLVLHNHQPIGNFDHVIEQAYEDSYRPFLDVFAPYDTLRIALHTSGSLMEWLDAHHPEYLDRLAQLVRKGRIEIVGGPFFEPILAMIPSRDRIGQIRRYSAWLADRLGASVRGMWMPERVWEQSFARDVVDAGMEYTLLDDCHFKSAGLDESDLIRHYVTEDEGRLLAVFPGSERLRYTIPFAQPQATLDHLRGIAEKTPDAVVVFGDDGEKFGTWPNTKQHCYGDRWLDRFFQALAANRDWLDVTTPSDALDQVAPAGKIYLADGSYREMTEWVLPPDLQTQYHDLAHDLETDPRWPALKRFVRGGFWRNFKTRYPEADEMYCRMMQVSRRLEEARESGGGSRLLDRARDELYRGQCNCGYWHGAFGGLYLPHLRNAIYRHLIAADNLLDQAAGRTDTWVEAEAGDFNLDGRQEVELANERLVALLAPAQGGQLYELDVRAIRHNLLATMARRPEAYHRKVQAGPTQGDPQCASIHDRVVFKQPGLESRLQYDRHPRKSLMDHFYDDTAALDQVASGSAQERGDFLTGRFDTRIRRNPDRIQIQMTRQGNAWGCPFRLTKGLTLNAGSDTLEIAYLLEDLPRDRWLHFAVEMNFAGLPAGADDRYFHNGESDRLGQLGARLDLHEVEALGLTDEWLGIDCGLSLSRPSHVWTFPIETVSQSEGGFELVHQSVAVLPHWYIEPSADGRWTVTMRLRLDTARAERRVERPALVASV